MVTVLLATYNGEKYIAEQLDSILEQTYKDIKVVIRDDGSTDNTINIINRYLEIYPETIFICPTTYATGSAAENFFKLLELNSDDYIMLCDQDDVWLPNKVEITLKAMREAESENTPVLVHTDLFVADENLNIISNSFAKFQSLSPNRNSLNNMLMQNNITGCTVMINKPLKELLFTYPKNCAMHDWWLGIIAAAFGKIVYVDTQTMLYRQHGLNQVGAKNTKSPSFLINRIKGINKSKEIYNKIFYHAEFMLENYKEMLNFEQVKLLKAVAGLKNMNRLQKIKTINRFKLHKNSLIRNIVQYFII